MRKGTTPAVPLAVPVELRGPVPGRHGLTRVLCVWKPIDQAPARFQHFVSLSFPLSRGALNELVVHSASYAEVTLMLLTKATICGYKSFRKRTELPISDRTTVLIGPNDHGKSNALLAIDCINDGKPFDKDDINDRFQSGEKAFISYFLHSKPQEIDEMMRAISESISAEGLGKTVVPPDETDADSLGRSLKSGIRADELTRLYKLMMDHTSVELIREAGEPDLTLVHGLEVPESVQLQFEVELQKRIPKVILFTQDALRQSPDVVNQSSLESNEVMQGVFRLAGIWDNRTALLSSNNRRNTRELREASIVLTQKIRENWTQGQDLKFHLEYLNNDIRLTVEDIASTVTAVGERSQGFTAYFAMRMLLVARTDEAIPNGFVFMFDEPGLNLHPKGQVDLQNVFEDISKTNQIIYSTHSVFLINKNYPGRNHLIFKNEDGSNIDNKPFVGGWAKVKEHLGLYLSSNFLFSDKVLLVEGATDEMYTPLILQGLIERNYFEGDLNAFAIQASLTEQEMIGAASFYTREERRVAILLDGDEEGKKRKTRIEMWKRQAEKDCSVITLDEFVPGTCSIEDFLEPNTFGNAVVSACREAIEANVLVTTKPDWETELQSQLESFNDKFSLGKAADEAQKQVFGDAVGKVWIARKYSELIRTEAANNNADVAEYWGSDILLKFARAIWKALDLPTRGDVTQVPLNVPR